MASAAPPASARSHASVRSGRPRVGEAEAKRQAERNAEKARRLRHLLTRELRTKFPSLDSKAIKREVDALEHYDRRSVAHLESRVRALANRGKSVGPGPDASWREIEKYKEEVAEHQQKQSREAAKRAREQLQSALERQVEEREERRTASQRSKHQWRREAERDAKTWNAKQEEEARRAREKHRREKEEQRRQIEVGARVRIVHHKDADAPLPRAWGV